MQSFQVKFVIYLLFYMTANNKQNASFNKWQIAFENEIVLINVY